jgi:hypothetical protein
MKLHAANESAQGILHESREVQPWRGIEATLEAGTDPMPLIVSTYAAPHVDRAQTAIDGPRLRARLTSIGYGFLTTLVSPHIVMAGGSLQQLTDHEHNPNAAQVRSLIKDVDMFAVGLTREALLAELTRIGETLRLGVWKTCKRIYVFRTRNCITFRCDGMGDAAAFQQPIIQVILRNHETMAHILYGFDLVRGEHSAIVSFPPFHPHCCRFALEGLLRYPYDTSVVWGVWGKKKANEPRGGVSA